MIYTVKEAASLLKVSERTIQKRCKRDSLGKSKGKWVIEKSHLDQWIEAEPSDHESSYKISKGEIVRLDEGKKHSVLVRVVTQTSDKLFTTIHYLSAIRGDSWHFDKDEEADKRNTADVMTSRLTPATSKLDKLLKLWESRAPIKPVFEKRGDEKTIKDLLEARKHLRDKKT